jgi:hypothetical protein
MRALFLRGRFGYGWEADLQEVWVKQTPTLRLADAESVGVAL